MLAEERYEKMTNQSAGENETFVTLIRVAQEDQEIREQLFGILQQSPFHRKSLLNSLVKALTIKGAPSDFVSAIAYLLDDRIAEKALELIKNKQQKAGQQQDP